MKMCEMNILENLLKALLCSVVGKNYQFCVYFCKRPQKSQNCRIVSDKQTRKNVFCVCLNGSHLAKDCSSKMKCFKYSERHHVALCDLEENSHKRSNSSSVANIAGVDKSTNSLFKLQMLK